MLCVFADIPKYQQSNEIEHNREKDYISNPIVIVDVGIVWSCDSPL